MKREKRKLLKIYFMLAIVIILVSLIFFGVIKYLFIYSKTKKDYNSTVLKIEKEKENRKKIDIEKEKIKINSEIEGRILEKNMLKRPGEKVIKLID